MEQLFQLARPARAQAQRPDKLRDAELLCRVLAENLENVLGG